ncbi:Papain_family cysteine protease [Hexamita inflata]|uniref:Papain family cysteine protease n=1 Tax=Hexamita inflata TaxID=28002 RepID=A0AA86R880_9EUKA|nr:Papain family cysteine protease [Hexamita inflata]
MLSIITCLTQTNITEKVCTKEFNKFMVQYSKNYSSELELQQAQFAFCKNYQFVLDHKEKNSSFTVAINKYSDLLKIHPSGYIPVVPEPEDEILEQFQQQGQIHQKEATYPHSDPYATPGDLTNYNRNNNSATDISTSCSSGNVKANPMSNTAAIRANILLSSIPPRVDLRKLGTLTRPLDQGSCGSCYAHGARNVFITMFMRDLLYYLQQTPYLAEWNVTTVDFKESVQYIMSRTFSDVNQFCSGGNFEYVATDLATTRIDTLEFESNFPYTSMYTLDNLTYETRPVLYTSKLTQKMNPIFYMGFNPTKYGCPRSYFTLPGGPAGYSAADENIIKSVLARGIAVATSMNTEAGTDAEIAAFQVYSGGIFAASCTKSSSNHQVTYVGYGNYKGQPVWVIQNSWGTAWGISGTFMVKRGTNPLCTEASAVISLNRYFGFEADQDVPFEQSQAYLTLKGKNYIDVNSQNIVYGVNGLDFEEGGWAQPRSSLSMVITLIIILLAALFVIYFLAIWLFCPPPNVLKPTIYIKMSDQDGADHDWSKAKEHKQSKYAAED